MDFELTIVAVRANSKFQFLRAAAEAKNLSVKQLRRIIINRRKSERVNCFVNFLIRVGGSLTFGRQSFFSEFQKKTKNADKIINAFLTKKKHHVNAVLHPTTETGRVALENSAVLTAEAPDTFTQPSRTRRSQLRTSIHKTV